MVKARKEEDGNIKIYGTLPSKFRGATGNYAGGFHLMDEDIIKQEGFYDLVIPEYNHFTEMLGQIYFDEQEEVFTYEVYPKPDLPSIEEAKENKVEELKKLAKNKFNETDWYFIRELHYQKNQKEKKIKSVPTEVIEEREWIYAVVEYKEAEINLLPDLESVLAYEVNLEIDMSEIEKPIEEVLSEEIIEEGAEEVLTETPTEGTETAETLPEETPASVEDSGVKPTETPTSVEDSGVKPTETPAFVEDSNATQPTETPAFVEDSNATQPTETPTSVEDSGVTQPTETSIEESPTGEKVIDIETIKNEINALQVDEISDEETSAKEENMETPLETITETISEVISKIKEPVSLALKERNKKRLENKIAKDKTKNKIAKLSTQIKNKNKSKKTSSKTKKSRA
jgi:hypothetical protein